MCGRYSEHIVSLCEWIDVLQAWDQQPPIRRNIAPLQTVSVVTNEGMRDMQWGLVPVWSKRAKTPYATFNARLESVSEKPTFRGAWQSARRCLIPCGGYYEWVTKDARKQPYFVSRKDGGPIVFGGLWENWLDKQTGDNHLSCTILTKPPGDSLKSLHHRMPVMLAREHAKCWLTGDPGVGQLIAEAASDDGLHFYAVSSRVNNSRVDDPALTDPVD